MHATRQRRPRVYSPSLLLSTTCRFGIVSSATASGIYRMRAPNWNGNVPSLRSVSIAARSRQPVAGRPEILVPRLRKAGNDLFRGSPRDLYAGMDDIAPGVHPRASSRAFFEAHPLRQHHSQRVVNPSHPVRGLAIRNHVADYRSYRLQYFDLQPATGFPGPSFTPFHLAVNICEFIPSPPVGKNIPGEFPAGLGCNTILKSEHNLPSCTPVFLLAEDAQRGSFVDYYLYIVSLTL
jgi:hypothetical protein